MDPRLKALLDIHQIRPESGDLVTVINVLNEMEARLKLVEERISHFLSSQPRVWPPPRT